MRKTLSYIFSFLIYSGISIIMIRFIPRFGIESTWKDIYYILPMIFLLCLLLSIFKPIIKIKNKDKNENGSVSN
jgi:putative exporter of polyketide antibiotics